MHVGPIFNLAVTLGRSSKRFCRSLIGASHVDSIPDLSGAVGSRSEKQAHHEIIDVFIILKDGPLATSLQSKAEFLVHMYRDEIASVHEQFDPCYDTCSFGPFDRGLHQSLPDTFISPTVPD